MTVRGSALGGGGEGRRPNATIGSPGLCTPPFAARSGQLSPPPPNCPSFAIAHPTPRFSLPSNALNSYTAGINGASSNHVYPASLPSSLVLPGRPVRHCMPLIAQWVEDQLPRILEPPDQWSQWSPAAAKPNVEGLSLCVSRQRWSPPCRAQPGSMPCTAKSRDPQACSSRHLRPRPTLAVRRMYALGLNWCLPLRSR